MNRLILGSVVSIIIITVVISALSISQNNDINNLRNNYSNTTKIGMAINTPTQNVSLQQLDQIFTTAASTGIGRSNVYLFWNLIEPERDQFDWSQSDILLGLYEKNDLKVTLYLSVINGEHLGPFPKYMNEPQIDSIDHTRLINVLDSILDRYHIIDTVIIAGETESQFRYAEHNIAPYRQLFMTVFDEIKDRHPDVQMGNAFGLHQVLNKNLNSTISELTLGDFVAFSYSPLDIVNDIAKTPEQAIDDLTRTFEMVPNKEIGFFEVSWSTSEFVGGNSTDQLEFIQRLFDFYDKNESDIAFMTWYRQYDRPEGTCAKEIQNIGDTTITIGSSSLGGNEYVIERLDRYLCNTGLIHTNGTVKSGWSEFQTQLERVQ